jgi:hypothetical protein
MKQLFLFFVLPIFNKMNFRLNCVKENNLNSSTWSLNNYRIFNSTTNFILLNDYTNFLKVNNNNKTYILDKGYDYRFYNVSENKFYKDQDSKLLYKVSKNHIFFNILNNLENDQYTDEHKLLYIKILDDYLENDKHISNNLIKPINMYSGGLFNDWNFEDFSEN